MSLYKQYAKLIEWFLYREHNGSVIIYKRHWNQKFSPDTAYLCIIHRLGALRDNITKIRNIHIYETSSNKLLSSEVELLLLEDSVAKVKP